MRREKRNYAVLAEGKVKFCGASVQQTKVQQICPAEDQGTGRNKYQGILILGRLLLPLSFSLLFSFFAQLPYFL